MFEFSSTLGQDNLLHASHITVHVERLTESDDCVGWEVELIYLLPLLTPDHAPYTICLTGFTGI